ncbi:MAG: UvrD-helicase domain-containing protein [Lachnospiraceae bacterium]
MYICEILKIDTFVVGDEKQSIYMWRGAYPKAFMSICDRDYFLIGAYDEPYLRVTNHTNIYNNVISITLL